MVEYSVSLDGIFGSLADPTRRDILQRLAKAVLTVSDVAKPYNLTIAAVSKHLKVLEKAKLIIKRRKGRQQYVALAPAAIGEASDYLRSYEKMWMERLDNFDRYLSTLPSTSHGHRRS